MESALLPLADETIARAKTIAFMESISLLEGLNEAQKQAVQHEQGPLLIVAGAGTGKTTVLTRRYAYLLQQPGTTTEAILALTFTEKAASEMEDRVLQLLTTGAYDFWISTFHGFCQRILEAHALDIGLPNQFRLLNTTDAWLLLRKHLAELPLTYYRPLGNPTKFLRALLSHISRAKDEGVTPEQYQAFVQTAVLEGDDEAIQGERARLQELGDLYVAYRRILREEGCLDFGDLILETLRLFRERPAILEHYRAQFQHVMVDEFQDTNWAQYELVKLLLGEKRNLTVVGDDDQAIYKFRGASLANILQFRDDFPEAKTVALTENYRSKKEILEIAYRCIRKNDPHRLEVKLQDTGLSKALTAVSGDGGEVRALWAVSDQAEAEAVIADIKRKKAQSPALIWNDFAILVRSNDGAEPFVRACERHRLPFQFLALRGLYSKPIVLDVFALLSLLDGYHESSAVWRVLGLPCYGFTAKDTAELLHEANRRGISLWMAVKEAARGVVMGELSASARSLAERVTTEIGELAATAKRSTSMQMLQLTLEKTGYLKQALRDGTEAEKQERIQYLNGFAERMRRYETMVRDASLRGFLEEFRLEMESGEEGALGIDPEAGPEYIKIMTVHAAKGLEFKHVYVVSLVDQRFPSRGRPEAIPLPNGLVQERLPEGDAHLEEERRLFYVAMTRAKETLTLTGGRNYGGSRDKKPSIFFAETGLALEEDTTAAHLFAETEPIKLEEQTSPIEHFELKRRFSFTQLAAFRKCPLQYKFEHIYRIPKLGKYQKSFGQSVHLTFERMLALHLQRLSATQGNLFEERDPSIPMDGFRVSEEEVDPIFEEAWIDEWYENRPQHDQYKENGRKSAHAFWRECTKQVPDVLSVERPFTLLMGKHSLKGKIDRVDRCSDGTVCVFDYKTGQAKDTLEAEDREQLYLYQIALENQGFVVSSLAYVYVLDWKTVSIEPLKAEKRDAFLKKMEERMEAILHSDFPPTPEPFSCRYCDFRTICEFKKL